MSSTSVPLDVAAAEEHLMRFLSVEGVTGHEAAIAAAVSDALQRVGVPASAIRFDDANTRIPLPTETGNLIVDLPGTRAGPRLLFSTHLDTVPLCAGAKPRREGDRIVSDGTTALGGDARTGVALLVVLAETLIKHKLAAPADHPAVHCARGERPARRPRTETRGSRRCGHVHQCRRATRLGADRRRGRAGELGSRDQGPCIACGRGARRREFRPRWSAPSRLPRRRAAGWFGKVVKPDGRGTSNVGIFGGKDGKPAGDATNVVTDYVYIRGEARSPEAAFAARIAKGYEEAFAKAKAAVTDHEGDNGRGDVQPQDSLPAI